VNLARDVDRLPFVGAFDQPARRLVFAFSFGHLLAHAQGLLVRPAGVMAVTDDVPVAVQVIAARIADRVAIALGDGPVVQFQVQEGIGQ